jgi:hypothetical protein
VTAQTGIAFAAALKAAAGKPVVVYASKGQYGQGIPGDLPLWNAAYPSVRGGDFRQLYAQAGGDSGTGWTRYSNRTPVFWQYSSSATIGSQAACDANAFRGSLADLLALTGDMHTLTTGGTDVKPFFAHDAAGMIYLCDGMRSRPIPLEWRADIAQLQREGLLDAANDINSGGRGGWYEGAFGVLDKPAAVDVQALAAAVVALLPPAATLDVQALTGPLADALAQHLPSHITLTGTVA